MHDRIKSQISLPFLSQKSGILYQFKPHLDKIIPEIALELESQNYRDKNTNGQTNQRQLGFLFDLSHSIGISVDGAISLFFQGKNLPESQLLQITNILYLEIFTKVINELVPDLKSNPNLKKFLLDRELTSEFLGFYVIRSKIINYSILLLDSLLRNFNIQKYELIRNLNKIRETRLETTIPRFLIALCIGIVAWHPLTHKGIKTLTDFLTSPLIKNNNVKH